MPGLELVDELPRTTELHQTAVRIGCAGCRNADVAVCAVVTGDRSMREAFVDDVRAASEIFDLPATILVGGHIEKIGIELESNQCDDPSRPCQNPMAAEMIGDVISSVTFE